MQFWSKGLGEKRVELFLSKGASTCSGDKLYLQGQMEAPVSWDYIMPLSGEDLADFFELMREQSLATCIYDSPDRWRLYRAMVTGGLALALLLLVAWVRSFSGSSQQEPVIQVPPPAERKKRPARRRLGSGRPTGPAVSETDSSLEEPRKLGSA